MNSFVKAMDDLNIVWKIILALPLLNIVWAVYRLMRSIDKKDTLGIVLAIVLIIVGWAILWIIDIITLIVSNRVLWIDWQILIDVKVVKTTLTSMFYHKKRFNKQC